MQYKPQISSLGIGKNINRPGHDGKQAAILKMRNFQVNTDLMIMKRSEWLGIVYRVKRLMTNIEKADSSHHLKNSIHQLSAALHWWYELSFLSATEFCLKNIRKIILFFLSLDILTFTS